MAKFTTRSRIKRPSPEEKRLRQAYAERIEAAVAQFIQLGQPRAMARKSAHKLVTAALTDEFALRPPEPSEPRKIYKEIQIAGARLKERHRRKTAPLETVMPQPTPAEKEARRLARAKLFADIPVMPLSTLRDLWRKEAMRLIDPTLQDRNPAMRDDAQRFVAAIEQEWARRTAAIQLGESAFAWPSTMAPTGTGQVDGGWVESGMLAYVGYHVGKTHGRTASYRSRLLDAVFNNGLPPLGSAAYMAEWGAPRSAERLRKMAESLAAFARNARRRRDRNLAQAIREWEADLDHLYDRYYVGHFGFGWPKR